MIGHNLAEKIVVQEVRKKITVIMQHHQWVWVVAFTVVLWLMYQSYVYEQQFDGASICWKGECFSSQDTSDNLVILMRGWSYQSFTCVLKNCSRGWFQVHWVHPLHPVLTRLMQLLCSHQLRQTKGKRSWFTPSLLLWRGGDIEELTIHRENGAWVFLQKTCANNQNHYQKWCN